MTRTVRTCLHGYCSTRFGFGTSCDNQSIEGYGRVVEAVVPCRLLHHPPDDKNTFFGWV